MNNHYFVKDEDGLFRMFDVSHDGFEDAIEVANEIGTDVMRERNGEVELAWSFEESGCADEHGMASTLTRKRMRMHWPARAGVRTRTTAGATIASTDLRIKIL